MVLVLSDEAMLEHRPGSGHPERPARLQAVLNAARGADATVVAPPLITRAALCGVHHEVYVDEILALEGTALSLDADTHVSEGSVHAAQLAAGAVVRAVDAVMDGDAQQGFALVRPPGHHAVADRAMGFCLFNNVALAAEQARARGAERVLIVDWDVHHGNGTEASFYGRGDVLVFNTHQAPFYPGTGAATDCGQGEGEGKTVNVPLPAGAGPGDFADVYERLLEPIAASFQPEMILVSAGFDGHIDDPLGMHELDDDAFAWLCSRVKRLADEHCGGKVVLTLEGGYDVSALERSVGRCLAVLGGDEPSRPTDPLRVEDAIERALAVQSKHWTSLNS